MTRNEALPDLGEIRLKGRLNMRPKIIALVFIGLTFTAASAQAAQLSSSSNAPLVYEAGAGIANNLTVTQSGQSVTFADTAENISVAAGLDGCTGAGTKSVTCPDHLGLVIFTDDLVDHVTVSRPDAFPGFPLTFIDGGPGNDVLTGGAESDGFLGHDGDGNDTLSGGGGVNVADYSDKTVGVTVNLDAAGSDNGASGEHDVFDAQINSAIGGDAADVITGGAGSNRIDGGDGADVISAGDGNDRIEADAYNGLAAAAGIAIGIAGPDGDADVIDGGPGADTIFVEGGDTVHAGDGNDTVGVGGAVGDTGSAETIFGDSGDDVVTPGDGNDTVDGGDGADTIVGESVVAPGKTDADDFRGGAGDDVIRGFLGDDTLDGGPGSDDLDGADGADAITGGSGVDTIDGGIGGDTVRALDGERDSIECRGGTDSVEADVVDAVAADCETITGGATPLGGTTPIGGPAPAGLPGPAGPTGASAPPTPFVLVAVDRALSGRRGKRVVVRYVSTLAGAATLVVKKGRKTVGTIRGRARADLNTIAWNAKQGGRKAPKGEYRLTLTVVALDGRSKTAVTTVSLR